jgi:hypothetical protein
MEETQQELRGEIDALMEQVMEAMGGGTLMLPEEIQRGMAEIGSPSLDNAGLKALRDDLQRKLEQYRAG